MRATPLFLAAFILLGCGKEAAPPPPGEPPKPAAGRVDVYPFALAKAAVFDAAVRFAQERTKTVYHAMEPVQVVWERIDSGGKASSAALVQLMVGQAKKLKPEDRVLAVIGVCERDLGGQGTDPVFFASSKEDRAGVFSWYRMSNEVLGLPADDARLGQRAGKQLIILTGRLLGLSRCAGSACVLGEPKDLPGLDAMSGDLCASCRKAWEAASAR